MKNMFENKIQLVMERAWQIRREVLRMSHHVGSGHVGGSLSEADILAALYFAILNIDPAHPERPDRDRFVLSKGHASPGYYSALALRGYFPLVELLSFHQLGSRLQGHPDMHKTPGVDFTSGSLGQGLSAALGLALAGKAAQLNYHSYVLMGDGELQEGQIWEAALYAGSKQVSGLIAILDNNQVQLAARTDQTLPLGNINAKWAAFGWQVLECDGHNATDLLDKLAQASRLASQGPIFINAHTIKGKGVSFMEGDYRWHGKAPGDEEYRQALAELEGTQPCQK